MRTGPGLTGYERLSVVIERLAGWYERLRTPIERMKWWIERSRGGYERLARFIERNRVWWGNAVADRAGADGL